MHLWTFELQPEEGNLLLARAHAMYTKSLEHALWFLWNLLLAQSCSRFQDYTATLAGKEAGTQYYHHKYRTCKSTWSIGERCVKNH